MKTLNCENGLTKAKSMYILKCKSNLELQTIEKNQLNAKSPYLKLLR